MAEGSGALRHAVRLRAVGKYLGQLGFVLASLTIVPFCVSLYFGDYGVSLRYGGVIVLLFLLAGLSRFLPTPSTLQQNEALAIVALAFILSPLLMSIPMAGAELDWSDAVFEAVSAVTTTGLSTLADVESMSPGFLFARAWSQWYGGLGIVVLSIALLHGHFVTSRRLIGLNPGEGLATTARTFARRTLQIYLVLTAAGVALLLLLGVDLMSAVEHALSAVSTGGFSPYNESLAQFGSRTLALAVIFTGLAGAVPFHLYMAFYGPSRGATLRDPELSLVLAVVVMAVLAIVLHRAGFSWDEAMFHGAVQAVSAQSTSGFASMPVGSIGDVGKLTLIISMLVGGGVGSTAGGFKVLRLLILLRLLQTLLQRTGMPEHAVTRVKLGSHPLGETEIQAALLLVLLFLVVIALSWFAFLACGYPALDSLFEVVSASATVGLSAGITGPDLEPLLRTVLCVDMLLGRVEIVAMLIVLYPWTWFGKRAAV